MRLHGAGKLKGRKKKCKRHYEALLRKPIYP